MKSITLASIVFTLSFCLNLEAEKNLPYKGSPSAGTKHYLVEVEDTENNNGERGTYMFRTKGDLSVVGDVIGGSIHNGKGGKVDIGADYSTVGRSKRSQSKCQKCRRKCKSKQWNEPKVSCKTQPRSYRKACLSGYKYQIDKLCNSNCKSKCR